MFHTSAEAPLRISPSVEALMAYVGRPLPSRFDLDLCRHQVRTTDCKALRLAVEARASSSCQAFRPAFDDSQWRLFGSFCVSRSLPAGHRLQVRSHADRAVHFVVDGGFWQAAGEPGAPPVLLPPGSIVGEEALFRDEARELDLRTLEHSVVLELSRQRFKELAAACPAIGFEILRAAGAVIAAGGRRDAAPN